MMGLEPLDLLHGKCEQPFAPVRARSLKPAVRRDFPAIERTRPKPSERRTLPSLPRSQAPSRGSARFSAAAHEPSWTDPRRPAPSKWITPPRRVGSSRPALLAVHALQERHTLARSTRDRPAIRPGQTGARAHHRRGGRDRGGQRVARQHAVLKSSMRLRNPNLDLMNATQVELLA